MGSTTQTLPSDPNDPTNGTGGGTGGSGGGTGGYGTQVMSLQIDKKDASSALDITVYLNCYSSDDLRFSAYVFVDGSLAQVGTANFLFDQGGSQAQGTMTVPAIVEGLAAGVRTITVMVKNRENEATLNVLPGSLIKITELRQAAR